LVNSVGEPLTGRSIELLLYPVSQLELSFSLGAYQLEKNNEEYLIFGSYPEVLTLSSFEEKSQYLISLVNSYILRDILSLEKVKGSKVLLDLLRLLAFQVGQEVSLTELASSLNIDPKTVARYLDLLEKSFIIYRLGGFSGNLRSEVTNKSKYFFFDNGIRNAIINNFNTLNMRDDVGRLWENFLIIERIKRQKYLGNNINTYFWRTYDQSEIDYIEESSGQLLPYEFKYSSLKKNKGFKVFEKLYPKTKVQFINKDDYIEFVCLPDHIDFTNLAETPNGRYLLQIDHEYPYLEKEIANIIDDMKSNSNDQWKNVKEKLNILIDNNRVKQEDLQKFRELIEGITTIFI
ncbi:MAG: ATP-binding protein, partial [Patescibacteria group bacterium]